MTHTTVRARNMEEDLPFNWLGLPAGVAKQFLLNGQRRPQRVQQSGDAAVDPVCAALRPDTARHYRGTVRNFLSHLGVARPEVDSLEQLRRKPHDLGCSKPRPS